MFISQFIPLEKKTGETTLKLVEIQLLRVILFLDLFRFSDLKQEDEYHNANSSVIHYFIVKVRFYVTSGE